MKEEKRRERGIAWQRKHEEEGERCIEGKIGNEGEKKKKEMKGREQTRERERKDTRKGKGKNANKRENE